MLKCYVFSFFQVFLANIDRDTPILHELDPVIASTRAIGIYTGTYHNEVSMRIEIYGCPITSKYFIFV